MLTEDENIVEIKFAVQYRLNDARAYLFESKDPPPPWFRPPRRPCAKWSAR
jgi:regulator of protease activity HflC (stomatin/prohibitin superfamily)